MNDLNNAVIAVDNNSTAITTPFLNSLSMFFIVLVLVYKIISDSSSFIS